MKIKNQIIFSISFLISATTLFSQSQNQGDKNTGTSPLMMFRPGETSAKEKGENQSSADVTSRNRTASEGPSSKALRGDPSQLSLPQEKAMSIQHALASDTRKHLSIAAEIDVATEANKKRIAAEARYNESVLERALLAQASEQAAARASEAGQQLEIKRQAHQQGVRNYVWSDRDFSAWELPGELHEIMIPVENCDIVVPPEMLHEKAEALGRRLLTEEQRLANRYEEDVEKMAAPLEEAVTVEEKIKNEIIAESLNPSGKNRALIEQRLASRARANELHRQAAVLAKESRRLREAQAAANAKASAANEKSSVLSSVKSAVFEAFSTVNIATGAGGREMPVDFETAVRLANKAEQAWELLALDSEKIKAGKEILSAEDRENILTIWKKADQELLSLNKKENAAQTLQESWQANVTRWRFCVAEEEAMQQLQCAEEKLFAAEETQAIINDRDLRGKTTSEKKAEASQQLIAAQIEVDAARAAAREAATAWRAEAVQHESVRGCSQEKERELALEKLHQSDQAVADVWFKLIDSDEAHLQDELTLEASQVRLKQESDRYALKQNMDRACYFGEASKVGVVLADAKKAYRQENKATAKNFYERANRLEIAACQEYREVVKQDALESARKRLPELISFWTQRMSKAQAEQEARATAAQFKKPSADSWADETQRALEHATAIAAAEEMGFHIYQKEERRLNDIETLLIAIIAAKKSALRERPGKAAAAYFEGDATAWGNLSADERERYNQEIREGNEKYGRAFEDERRVVEEQMARTRSKVEKRKYVTNDEQLALARFQVRVAERNKFIRWGAYTPAERANKKETLKMEAQRAFDQMVDFLEAARNRVADRKNVEDFLKKFLAFDAARIYSTKAAKAICHGEVELAALWEEAAKIAKKGTEPRVSAYQREVLTMAEAMAEGIEWRLKEQQAIAEGKMKEMNYCQRAIQLTEEVIDMCKNPAEENCESYAVLSNVVPRKLKMAIAWRKKRESLNQENKTRSAGQNEEADFWKNVVQEYDKAIELYQQSINDGYWAWELEHAADYTMKAAKIIVDQIGWRAKQKSLDEKDAALISLWFEKLIQKADEAIACYRQSVNAIPTTALQQGLQEAERRTRYDLKWHSNKWDCYTPARIGDACLEESKAMAEMLEHLLQDRRNLTKDEQNLTKDIAMLERGAARLYHEAAQQYGKGREVAALFSLISAQGKRWKVMEWQAKKNEEAKLSKLAVEIIEVLQYKKSTPFLDVHYDMSEKFLKFAEALTRCVKESSF